MIALLLILPFSRVKLNHSPDLVQIKEMSSKLRVNSLRICPSRIIVPVVEVDWD